MAGTWHIEEDVERALIRLNEEICRFERSTGRGCHLILIPNHQDEPIFLSDNGKPLPLDTSIPPEAFFEGAMDFRSRDGVL